MTRCCYRLKPKSFDVNKIDQNDVNQRPVIPKRRTLVPQQNILIGVRRSVTLCHRECARAICTNTLVTRRQLPTVGVAGACAAVGARGQKYAFTIYKLLIVLQLRM